MGRITAFRFQRDEFQPFPIEADNFDQALIQIGRGTYTVFRLYPGDQVLYLSKHLERLRHSAALIGMPFPHSDDKLREAIRLAINAVDARQLRVCLMVTLESPDFIFVMLEEFHPIPEHDFRKGVRVSIRNLQREQPDAKDSSFVNIRQQLKSKQKDFNEILLVDEQGYIIEGSSSNFFTVLNKRLHTADKNILDGITRSIVLQVAPKIIEVSYSPVHVSDLPNLEEAFLTSSSRGVLPVVEVNGTRIGNGEPGPITIELHKLFKAQIEAEIESI
ncbi:MAG: aminotransferase class IV [Anaerolineaceae bacterium]|nr:aminotransferase class IV [Anaerolineaceae bacterium]